MPKPAKPAGALHPGATLKRSDKSEGEEFLEMVGMAAAALKPLKKGTRLLLFEHVRGLDVNIRTADSNDLDSYEQAAKAGEIDIDRDEGMILLRTSNQRVKNAKGLLGSLADFAAALSDAAKAAYEAEHDHEADPSIQPFWDEHFR